MSDDAPAMSNWTIRNRTQDESQDIRAAYAAATADSRLLEFRDDKHKIVYLVATDVFLDATRWNFPSDS